MDKINKPSTTAPPVATYNLDEISNTIKSMKNEIELLKKENKELREGNKKLNEEIRNFKENFITIERIDTLYPNNLHFNNVKVIQNFINLNKDSIQYGPYKKYEKGKYCIVYYGKNLSNLCFDCCDDCGKKLLEISMIIKFPDKVVYEVLIPENNKCIEFRAISNQNDSSIIEKINVYKYNY